MSYKVAMRNNDTGEVRMIEHEFDWDPESSQYFWTDGMCDCVAAQYFARAAGEPDPVPRPCGYDRYDMLYAEFQDGRRIEITGIPELLD